jgi:hypothetical protein
MPRSAFRASLRTAELGIPAYGIPWPAYFGSLPKTFANQRCTEWIEVTGSAIIN